MPPSEHLLFKALADPTRRTIFERLCREGEQSVGRITADAGISQPAVSKHMIVLKQAGLVQDHHAGRETRYRPRHHGLAPLADWTRRMTAVWQSRLDDLDTLLTRMDQ